MYRENRLQGDRDSDVDGGFQCPRLTVVLVVWMVLLRARVVSGGGILPISDLQVIWACPWFCIPDTGSQFACVFCLNHPELIYFVCKWTCLPIVWSSVPRPVKAKWVINVRFENSRYKLWNLSNPKIHMCSPQSGLLSLVYFIVFQLPRKPSNELTNQLQLSRIY